MGYQLCIDVLEEYLKGLCLGQCSSGSAQGTVIWGNLINVHPAKITEGDAIVQSTFHFVITQSVPALQKAHIEQQQSTVGRLDHNALSPSIVSIYEYFDTVPIDKFIYLSKKGALYLPCPQITDRICQSWLFMGI